MDWPVDLLEKMLHFLAMDGAAKTWKYVAYLSCNNKDLAKTAKKIAQPLVLRIGFDGQGSDAHFVLPFSRARFIRVRIDWGDGSPYQIVDEIGEGFVSHDFPPGEYTVRVFPHGAPADGAEDSWLDHLGWGPSCLGHSEVEKTRFWYRPIRSFDSLGSLGIRSLSHLFLHARDFNIPLSNHDVSNIRDMSYMFYSASEFNQHLGNWNVSRVIDMTQMFAFASRFNQPIHCWNVSQVRSMRAMFCFTEVFNQTLSPWNVSRVIDMSEMFQGAIKFNQPISNWDVSQVKNMARMFMNAWKFNQNLQQWDVRNVVDTSYMFFFAKEFSQPLWHWKLKSVKRVGHMFSGATKFPRKSAAIWQFFVVNGSDRMFD